MTRCPNRASTNDSVACSPSPPSSITSGEAIIRNPIVGQQSKNPALREWHTQNLGRLPGLKFMRTLWVCNVAGGPFEYAPTVPGSTVLGLEEAHRKLRISPDEFDEVAAELAARLNVECPGGRRARCSPHSPRTKARSPKAIERRLVLAPRPFDRWTDQDLTLRAVLVDKPKRVHDLLEGVGPVD